MQPTNEQCGCSRYPERCRRHPVRDLCLPRLFQASFKQYPLGCCGVRRGGDITAVPQDCGPYGAPSNRVCLCAGGIEHLEVIGQVDESCPKAQRDAFRKRLAAPCVPAIICHRQISRSANCRIFNRRARFLYRNGFTFVLSVNGLDGGCFRGGADELMVVRL